MWYKSLGDESPVKPLLIDKGYIRTNHVLAREEFENVKAYIVISFTNFTLNEKNPEFSPDFFILAPLLFFCLKIFI